MARPLTYWIVAAVLMLLLAATVGVSFLRLGPLGIAVALAIAGTKATLVALYFMHVRSSSPLMRLFAVAGLVWLALLIGLTLTDYLTRGEGWPADRDPVHHLLPPPET